MPELLHVHHDYYLHEVSHMQTVGGRVETDVELYFLVSEKFSYLVLIGRLLDEASFFKYVVGVIEFAHVVRYKIKFHW